MAIIFSFPVGYFLTDRTRIIEAMTPTTASEVVSRRGSNAKFLVPAIFSNYGISVNPPRPHYKSIHWIARTNVNRAKRINHFYRTFHIESIGEELAI